MAQQHSFIARCALLLPLALHATAQLSSGTGALQPSGNGPYPYQNSSATIRSQTYSPGASSSSFTSVSSGTGARISTAGPVGTGSSSSSLAVTSISSTAYSNSSSVSISLSQGTGLTTSTSASTTSGSLSANGTSASSSSVSLGTGASSSPVTLGTGVSSSSVTLGTGVSSSSIPSGTGASSSTVSVGTGMSSGPLPTSSSANSTFIPGALTSPPVVVSVTTAIDGTTTVIPYLSGGDVTSPVPLTPTITFAPTASEASSSKTALETQLSSVFPVIQNWLDDDTEDIGPIIDSLDNVEQSVEDLLSDIEDDLDKDTSKGCTHSLFSLLSCIVDDVTKIKSSVTDTLVDDVEDELADLKNLTQELDDEDDDDDNSSSSSASSSSSSSSCTASTSITEDVYITCEPTVVSSSVTQTCRKATSTVSGCSVSAFTTTTTISSTTTPSGLCAQTGCASCTDDSLPTPSAECTDCTTVSGVAYPTQQTTVPSGVAVPTSLSDLDNSANSTSSKQKRTLPSPEDYTSYSDFFANQLAIPGLINVPHRPAGTGGSSSAVLRAFDGTSRLSMTVQGLFGCTSLVLISRKGVYMSHMFENPGFVKYDEFGLQTVSDFTTDIYYAIPNGDPTPIALGSIVDGEPWLPELNSLSDAGAMFDPNQEGGVRAFIVTPGPQDQNDPGPYRYNAEVFTILNWATGKFDPSAAVYIYTSTNVQLSNNQNSATGKVLFQFDPAQATAFDNDLVLGGQRFTCPIQYAGLKLWIGYQDFLGNDFEAYYEDTWASAVGDTISPLPLGTGTIVSRDEVPNACVAVSSSGSASASTSASASGSTSVSVSRSTSGVASTFSTIVSTSSVGTNNATSIGNPTTSSAVSTTSSALVATGTCSTDESDAEYGQCAYVGLSGADKGVVEAGACPSSSPCQSLDNGVCYFAYADDSITCGGQAGTSSSAAATATASSTCDVPSGCTNEAAPTGCAVACS